jgi:uncharacterized protein (TIGR03083 family)
VNLKRPTHSDSSYVQRHLETFSALIPSTDLSVAVPGCPLWTTEALITHLGTVLHRVAEGISTGSAPVTGPTTPPTSDPAQLQIWFEDVANRIIGLLATTDPEATVWQPFPAPARVEIWRRRLTHETMIHLWDLHAARHETPIVDPVLASDGIDEFVDLLLLRLAAAADFVAPTGSLHLHCTDVEGEWWMEFDASGHLTLRREHAKGDAAIRGTAAGILLGLWNRPRPEGWAAPEVIGDAKVAAAWMNLPGL